jgi:hypothetical protein
VPKNGIGASSIGAWNWILVCATLLRILYRYPGILSVLIQYNLAKKVGVVDSKSVRLVPVQDETSAGKTYCASACTC